MKQTRKSAKVNGQLKTSNQGSRNIDKKGATGVYGANPSPALSAYKQSAGKDTIPIKFAETELGTTKRGMNPMRSAMKERMGVPKPITSAKVMTGKNRYRSAGMMGGKKG